ncbi:MAG TPA: hypothetical protein PK075_01145 [Chitinophagales bacterium]|nr:hypothetical protein [Chitinophagales bacterium]
MNVQGVRLHFQSTHPQLELTIVAFTFIPFQDNIELPEIAMFVFCQMNIHEILIELMFHIHSSLADVIDVQLTVIFQENKASDILAKSQV